MRYKCNFFGCEGSLNISHNVLLVAELDKVAMIKGHVQRNVFYSTLLLYLSVPLGTSRNRSYMGAKIIRERIGHKILQLFVMHECEQLRVHFKNV